MVYGGLVYGGMVYGGMVYGGMVYGGMVYGGMVYGGMVYDGVDMMLMSGSSRGLPVHVALVYGVVVQEYCLSRVVGSMEWLEARVGKNAPT